MAEMWEKKQRYYSRGQGYREEFRTMAMVSTSELKEWAFTTYKNSKNPKKRRKAIKELEKRGMKVQYV
tara:strand:- start:968 stop:1171 length:204 start_codon:yes stop_codon:yes gene_type:complete